LRWYDLPTGQELGRKLTSATGAGDQGEIMKYLKMLGLAGLRVAALMAFVGAGTASATGGVLCSTASGFTPCTSRWTALVTFDWSLKAGTSAEVKVGEAVLNTCTAATVRGRLTSNPSGGSATGSYTEVTWGTAATPCTRSTVTTKLGAFRVESDGDGNGILIADEEMRWTTLVDSLFTCEYGVKAGTTIGTLDEGKPATLTVNVVLQRLNDCFASSETVWTATYVQTEPTNTTFYVSTS
jgi:hypothetical protein